MKGRISLPDFIAQVKQELIEGQDKSGNPFLELEEVTLEANFVLDTSARAGAKLYVLEFGTEAKAQQSHKVVLKFLPVPKGELPGRPAYR